MPGNAFIKFLLVLVLAYLLFFIITSYFSFYFYILLGTIPNNNYTVIYSSCQDKRRKSSLISAFSAFCTMKIFMIFLLFLKTQKLFFFQNYRNHQYVLPKKKICDRIQNNRIRRGGVTINKSELVAIMAEKASLSKKDAEGALNAFVDAVKDAVKKNDKVQLVGFGTFESRKREAREGKNPQTGEKIKIAACNPPAFKPGKGFKDYIN